MRAHDAAPTGVGSRERGYIDGGNRRSVQRFVHAREAVLAFLRRRLTDHGVTVPADADLDTTGQIIAARSTESATLCRSRRTGGHDTCAAALEKPEATW